MSTTLIELVEPETPKGIPATTTMVSPCLANFSVIIISLASFIAASYP